jgi:hypothetical protein
MPLHLCRIRMIRARLLPGTEMGVKVSRMDRAGIARGCGHRRGRIRIRAHRCIKGLRVNEIMKVRCIYERSLNQSDA